MEQSITQKLRETIARTYDLLAKQREEIKNLELSLFNINDTLEQEVLKQARNNETRKSNKTKREQAFCLYRVYQMMPNSTRNEVIQAFVDQLNMTPNGAASYYQQAKKYYEDKPLPAKAFAEEPEQLPLTLKVD